MNDAEDRTTYLLAEGKKFCSSIGLKDDFIDDLIKDVYRSDNDWAFILKIDALLETGMKEVIARSLKMELKGKAVGEEELQNFIFDLNVNGRTSLLRLIRLMGCYPKDICDFIEKIRGLRNSYAHNIKLVNDDLFTVIKNREDRSDLLKKLVPVVNFDEEKYIKEMERDGSFLRFGMMDITLRFLMLAHNSTAVK